MKFKRILIYSSFFILHSALVSAQEHLGPLRVNPALVKYTKEAKKNHAPVWRLLSDSIMAKLPFLDDFSHGGPYPNDSLWMDNAAFINNTYPICPHTLGVATLDGVNSEGQPYNPSCPIGASYPADSLTSRPINMSIYQSSDSIYFSFYYQAGGNGYAPLPADSLLLQFRTSGTPWTTIWYHLGYTPGPTDTSFHYVLIAVNDTTHYSGVLFNPFDPNFQFRFKNYACTSADIDQWNIDEVYMDKLRPYSDTAQNDVSFVYQSPSLLAKYQYMPWEQFTANDLKDSMFICERNNTANTLINMSYRDTIPAVGLSYPIGTGYRGGSANMAPFISTGYHNDPRQTHIPIKTHFNYNALTGPANITLTHILSATGDFDAWNDTLRFDQIFSDYYAYDDGTAEASYFINGTTPMYLAYQFTLNHADTLRGLELYFNYLFVNPANYSFRLAVWDNTGTGGSPGNLLFEDDTIYSPKVSDSLNGFTFYPYHFPSTAASVFGGTFYVGWVQTYGDSLNIGYDLNTDHHNQIYYNANTYPAGWNIGTYPGSLMMRPVFGIKGSHARVLDVANVEDSYESLSIYPNPATDRVTLSSPLPANTVLRIYTADGRQYMGSNNFFGNSINTSLLPAGFYIVAVTTAEGKTFYQKLLIQR